LGFLGENNGMFAQSGLTIIGVTPSNIPTVDYHLLGQVFLGFNFHNDLFEVESEERFHG
jgi:hypothetical protein